ncbi:MAG: penicillin-binding protein 2 [Chloroflexota bacterium]|nr:penicillin-binding protein 2 [Chloroflexota bacterium]
MSETTASGGELRRSGRRFTAFAVATVLVFATLSARLFQLQILGGGFYADEAAVREVEIPIPAPRGLVFDRDGRRLVANVPSWTIRIRPANQPPEVASAVLARLGALTHTRAADLRARLDAYRGSPYDAVPVIRGVERSVAMVVAEESDGLPGVEVSVEPIRQYLDGEGNVDGSMLAHILGYTGPIDAEELAARADDGYLPDDLVGKTGVEASFEDVLRGTYGSQLVEGDVSGRTVKVLDTLADPVPGRSVMLTIDTDIQRMATDALRWGMEVAGVRQGVTIVMNPQTGEILAMVSLPSYDNNAFASGIDPQRFAEYLDDGNRPLRNHAIQDIYPPGSTYKLVTALAALEEGVTAPSQRWPTYGCYQIPGAPAGECLHDWNRAGFGPLDITDAFAVSSDTFFYQMAVKLGIDRLATWGNELGFGEPTGIALPDEASGTVPSTRWAQSQGREGVYTGEVAQAGIGQNVVDVTPLQLLNAYAALANGGHLMRPMIVRGETDGSGELTRSYQPELIRDIAASPENLRTLRVAAREVITTGHAYNIKDVPLPGMLSGKTGTAEFGEPLPDGGLPFHSWFVAYLPSQPGATDAELAVLTFTYAATVPGNVSTEVVKYFLQQYFDVARDYRLDPRTFELVNAN